MILRRSKPDGADKPKRTYYYQCDKFASYTSISSGIRNTSTKATNCPFKLQIKREADTSNEWWIDVKPDRHNHPPSSSPTIHGIHRRRAMAATDTYKTIVDLTKLGQPPKQIAAAVRERYPTIIMTRQDINNTRLRHRIEQLDGLTPLKAMMKRFEATPEQWLVEARLYNRYLTHLFFTTNA